MERSRSHHNNIPALLVRLPLESQFFQPTLFCAFTFVKLIITISFFSQFFDLLLGRPLFCFSTSLCLTLSPHSSSILNTRSSILSLLFDIIVSLHPPSHICLFNSPVFPNLSSRLTHLPSTVFSPHLHSLICSFSLPTFPNCLFHSPTFSHLSLQLTTFPNLSIQLTTFPNLSLQLTTFPNLSLQLTYFPSVSSAHHLP